MGKNVIYTYSCDNCKADFKSPNDVISINGFIVNGENERIYLDLINQTDVLCKRCFANIITQGVACKVIEPPPVVIPKQEIPKEDIDYVTLRKIETNKDEQEFVKELGHVSMENFRKLCSLNLIGCYYPIDEPCALQSPCPYECDATVIYAALAGIPQTKTTKVFYDNKSPFAYIERSKLGSE
jgi:hypothetical protein